MLILTIFNDFNETNRTDWTYSFNVVEFEILCTYYRYGWTIIIRVL